MESIQDYFNFLVHFFIQRRFVYIYIEVNNFCFKHTLCTLSKNAEYIILIMNSRKLSNDSMNLFISPWNKINVSQSKLFKPPARNFALNPDISNQNFLSLTGKYQEISKITRFWNSRTYIMGSYHDLCHDPVVCNWHSSAVNIYYGSTELTVYPYGRTPVKRTINTR